MTPTNVTPVIFSFNNKTAKITPKIGSKARNRPPLLAEDTSKPLFQSFDAK